jgi:TatD DNase family protein
LKKTKTNLIDIGINLTNKQFVNDFESVINNAVEQNVSPLVLTGTSIKSSLTSAELAKKYPNILFSTAGIHPHDAKSFDNNSIEALRKLLSEDHVISVGECGLDFDRDFSPRPIQEKCFIAQLELAIAIQKPLFLHERAAFVRFNSIVDDFIDKLPHCVVHCFTGSISEAKSYLDKGFYLGFTGAISDTKRFEHLQEVIKYAPLEKIMIETDAPYMMPKNIPKEFLMKNNERRCEPKFLPYVALTIAEIKNIDIEKVAFQSSENAKLFFKIGQ